MAACSRTLGVLLFCLFHAQTALPAETSASPDPALADLIRAAREQALVQPERFERMQRRQRLSALLPDVSVFVGRGLMYSRRQTEAFDGPSLYDGDRLSYSVSARWDLSRMLFSPTELQVEREAQRAALLRRELDVEVTRLYLARRALMARPMGPAEMARLDRLTRRLHALTGGMGQAGSPPLARGDDGGDGEMRDD